MHVQEKEDGSRSSLSRTWRPASGKGSRQPSSAARGTTCCHQEELLKTPSLSFPDRRRQQYLFKKAGFSSPQYELVIVLKEEAAFNPQWTCWLHLQHANCNGARCTQHKHTGNFQICCEVSLPEWAVNLPFVLWKTRPVGGYLILWVSPDEEHSYLLSFYFSRTLKADTRPGGEFPISTHSRL